MNEKLGLDSRLLFLSDPELRTAEAWALAVSRRHPRAKHYPRGAFLQPSVLIFDAAGDERFAWRSTPRLLNAYGAIRRKSPAEILAEVERLASS